MEALLWLCCQLALPGADSLEAPALHRFEFEAPAMGSRFRMALYAADPATAIGARDAVWSRIADLEATLSDYREDSELSRLSRTAGAGRWIAAGSDLWPLLLRSQEIAAISDGAFDITIGPAVRLWRRARRVREWPDAEDLASARVAIGPRLIELDPATRRVRLSRPGMILDLGGIAKGYAADEALKVLECFGVHRALFAASGDIAVSGAPPGEKGWRVGIAPAFDADAPAERFLELEHAGCSTSGDAYQSTLIGGRRAGHIVDPRTALALESRGSVTVVAKDATTSDALATAAFVLGPEKGIELIRAVPGAEVSFEWSGTSPAQSSDSPGFAKLLRPGDPARDRKPDAPRRTER